MYIDYFEIFRLFRPDHVDTFR